jgi:hypothetical protein
LNEISLDQVSIRVGTTNLNEYQHQANVCSPRQEQMTINVSDGSRIDSATITSASADDNVVLTIDGTTVFDSGRVVVTTETNGIPITTLIFALI